MSVNSIGSNNPILPSIGDYSNISRPHSLDTSKLNDLNSDANEGKSSTLKGLVIKGINNELPSNGIEFRINDASANQIYTGSFESFLNSMRGISTEQASTLQNALNSAANVLESNQTQADTYAMRISQANMELRLVSEKLIPEQYRDRFNSYIDNFTKQLCDNYVGFEKCLTSQVANTTDPVLIQTGWQQKEQQTLRNLEDGTDVFQTSAVMYKGMFDGIDVTDTSKAKDQLNSIYKNIINNGGAYSQDLSTEVRYLSDKWNELMDTLGENNKIATSINCFA